MSKTGSTAVAPRTAPGDDPGRSALAGAVLSQGVVAASSLVLQLLALWRLGTSGLGAFAVLNGGWMVVSTALHTGWIGDPIVVLDRHSPRIRSAILFAFAVGAAGTLVLCTIGGWLTAGISFADASLFGVMMVLWLGEETARRVFAARAEFTKLLYNDLVYAVVAVGIAGALALADRLSMAGLLIAMAAGAGASIAAAYVQLPPAEIHWTGASTEAVPELAHFAAWRSLQLAMRPLTLLAVRILIGATGGLAAVGIFEAGRIAIAPLLTLANGIGAYTLTRFTRLRAVGRLRLDTLLRWATIAVGASLAAAPLVVVSALVVNATGNVQLGWAQLVAWSVFAVANAANVVVVNAMSARAMTRRLFLGRCIDTALSLLGTVCVLTFASADVVPVVLTLGMATGTAWAAGGVRWPTEPTTDHARPS